MSINCGVTPWFISTNSSFIRFYQPLNPLIHLDLPWTDLQADICKSFGEATAEMLVVGFVLEITEVKMTAAWKKLCWNNVKIMIYCWEMRCIHIYDAHVHMHEQCIWSTYVYEYETHIYIYIYEPGPRTPTPPPSPPMVSPPLLTPPPPQNLVFACYLHIYIHIYTYILPFPPLQPRISTLFAALESHDLVNGPCLPVYFYHNLFFEPPIACLAHGLQHICYLWITQSLPMQT